MLERAGHAEASLSGMSRLRAGGICSFGGTLGAAVISVAAWRPIPEAVDQLSADTGHASLDRRATSAGAKRSTWISASGHSASGGSEWDQRGVTHQRGG